MISTFLQEQSKGQILYLNKWTETDLNKWTEKAPENPETSGYEEQCGSTPWGLSL